MKLYNFSFLPTFHYCEQAIRKIIKNNNQFEKTETLTGIVAWSICAVTGFLATLMAAATPPHIGIFSGFIYSTLSITIYFSTRQIMRCSKK